MLNSHELGRRIMSIARLIYRRLAVKSETVRRLRPRLSPLLRSNWVLKAKWAKLTNPGMVFEQRLNRQCTPRFSPH